MNIECTPTNKFKENLISNISVKLYQSFSIKLMDKKFEGKKFLYQQNGMLLGKNSFIFNFRLPNNIPGTVIEKDIVILTFLEFTINLIRGSAIKVKKIVNVKNPSVIIPEISENFVFGAKIYNEKLFYI